MARKLVDYYDYEYALNLADKLQGASPSFDINGFLEIFRNRLGNESFLQRQDIFADAMEASLAVGYDVALDTFRKIWGEELKQETGMFKEGWWLWPIGRFVERHVCEAPAISFAFIKDFTKRHTGEFAIRPLLISDPELTMEQMLLWSMDDNVHVRRLSSEGMRIYLPWARKTDAAIKHYQIYKNILANLKDDSSRFVQKSVGNNLNDLYKYDRNLAEGIIEDWRSEELSASSLWIIKHGQRKQKAKKAAISDQD